MASVQPENRCHHVDPDKDVTMVISVYCPLPPHRHFSSKFPSVLIMLSSFTKKFLIVASRTSCDHINVVCYGQYPVSKYFEGDMK